MDDLSFLKYLVLHHQPLALSRYVDLLQGDLLRALLRGEAEGEPDPGPEAVAWVVCNRARHPGWWGSTVRQCALWPQQFSCFWSDLSRRNTAMMDELENPTPRLAVAVQRALYNSGLGHLDRDPVAGATLYYNPDVCHPRWADRVRVVRRIAHHVFCTED